MPQMPPGLGNIGYAGSQAGLPAAQQQGLAAIGYGGGAPSPAQMMAMSNMGGQTPTTAAGLPAGVGGPSAYAPGTTPAQLMGATPPQRKRGGRTPGMRPYTAPHMEAGAGSGAGRLEKIEKYD
jgi:hypothetical protein